MNSENQEASSWEWGSFHWDTESPTGLPLSAWACVSFLCRMSSLITCLLGRKLLFLRSDSHFAGTDFLSLGLTELMNCNQRMGSCRIIRQLPCIFENRDTIHHDKADWIILEDWNLGSHLPLVRRKMRHGRTQTCSSRQ